MRTLVRGLTAALVAVLLLVIAPPAQAEPDIPLPPVPLPGGLGLLPGPSDCKEAPTPESPGQGIAGFFSNTPDELPPEGDPFAKNSKTTIYEQYGYAGLRYRTYDLGCGPDAMRSPDAVIGTAVSNWIMQPPLALSALTGSLTEVAFRPTFLDGFNPVIERVSAALHESLFASWIPAVLALLGGLIIFRARRQALATTAGAIGWALIVVLLATAFFRWPIAAGNAADQTVTQSLGTVVGKLDGDATSTDPGMAVSSQVNEAILYRAWLAGTFGSPDSKTAEKYGADLFKSQALTWREAALAERDPEEFQKVVEAKKKSWTEITDKIREEDPEAYEHLTGERSETRVGYAVVSGLGVFLALPFLLLSSLLMLGCYLIVRLAVMMFPAFAVLGAFPSSRGLVTGLGRTVAAAVVNAIIFGIGAGVTVTVLGILFHPGGGAPGWLSLVLMPLFSFIMWVALRPFRRLTTMVSPDSDHFGQMSNPLGGAGRRGKHWAKQAILTGLAAGSGGAAGAAAGVAATASKGTDEEHAPVPMRAEALPTRPAPRSPLVLEAASSRHDPPADAPSPETPYSPSGRHEARPAPGPAPSWLSDPAAETTPRHARELPQGFVPRPTWEDAPAPPTEPEWYDGEEVYPIYRPGGRSNDVA